MMVTTKVVAKAIIMASQGVTNSNLANEAIKEPSNKPKIIQIIPPI